MLIQRILTAAVLIPVMVWLVFFAEQVIFQYAMLLIVSVGGWEWARLVGFEKTVTHVAYAALVAVVGYILLVTSTLLMIAILSVLILLVWTVNIVQVFQYQGELLAQGELQKMPMFSGIVILPATAIFMIQIHDFDPQLLFVCMLLIWTADTGAYFSGRQFGKKKLAPSVSPGKSWEGVYGGMMAVVVVAYFASGYVGYTGVDQVYFVLLAIVGVALSVFGDLYESLLKRKSGIKDSSQILPGHGGILDRTDSMLSAMPLFCLGFILIKLANQ
ncbi:MAG: phosphatidate cytidylyltransferase [Methylococcales bacterium]|jgi:phosphatidate cytidylyltransferase|nr:phosphatidate cytidylyltransferase [Methylococcales bacterium]MBT7443857.1 phosphatidate cytidylyltransferase [Methylococcales bacterium]